MTDVIRDGEFETTDDPLADPRTLRVLLCCLMARLGEKQHAFRQEDFDAVQNRAMQCEFTDDTLILHVADSLAQLPGPGVQ